MWGHNIHDTTLKMTFGANFFLDDFNSGPPTKSSERTGIYSACILGVLLRCQRHDQLVVGAQSETWLTGVSSIFSYLGIFCNFNIIFNLVVGPICRRNLHRQPLHHSTRLVETRLMIELDLYIYLFSMELRSFEKPYAALLNSSNRAYKQPIWHDLPGKSFLPKLVHNYMSHTL